MDFERPELLQWIFSLPVAQSDVFIEHGPKISDDVIAHLGQLAEAFMHDGADVYLDDIVQASILAVAAETGKQSVTMSPELLYEWIGALRFIVALERMKRDGLIELDADVGISTIRETKVTLTDRGMQAGLELRARLS